MTGNKGHQKSRKQRKQTGFKELAHICVLCSAIASPSLLSSSPIRVNPRLVFIEHILWVVPHFGDRWTQGPIKPGRALILRQLLVEAHTLSMLRKATRHLREATKEEAPPLLHALERQRRRRPVICSHAVIVHPGCLADDVVPYGWPSLLALSLQPLNQRTLIHQSLRPSALGLQGVSHNAETEDEDGRQQWKVRSQMMNRAKTSPCSVLWCTCGDQQCAVHLSG